MNYKTHEEIVNFSRSNPSEFWSKEAEDVFWYEKPSKILDDSDPPYYKWFVDGKTNLCYNALDRHALGPKRGTAALIWESPETGNSRIFTYYELYKKVNQFAGVLKNLGVVKGDRIIIYLPLVPEAVIAMLACVRIGAIHSVVFAGFSEDALSDRIDDAKPKLLLTADAGSRNGKIVKLKGIVDNSIDKSIEKPEYVIVLNRKLDPDMSWKEGRDLDWNEQLKTKGEQYVEPEVMNSTDASYILYTSGTTGKPKGTLRDTGGYLVGLNASMKYIYDLQPNRDVIFSTSDIGWIVGHSYIVYAPLIIGIPTIMFEGTPIYPDEGIWWRVIEKYGVTLLWTAPTALRMLKKYPSEIIKERDLTSLKYVFLAGEPFDIPTYNWTKDILNDCTIIDHYWQTESGWPMISNMPGVEELAIKPGSPTKSVVGWDLIVVDENGNEMPQGEKGILVAKPPLPPGTLGALGIYKNPERYKAYWNTMPGNVFNTYDYAILDEDKYFWILGRADEIIKIAAHRLGTRELEEAVSSHPAVAETTCVGVDDAIKGSVVVTFVVLKQGYESSETLKEEIKQKVATMVGKFAVPKAVEIVQILPKTRSGKIMRRVLKGIYEDKEIGDLSTIEDGASIQEVTAAIELMKEELKK
jgi:propionyl-CoA synthetase